jgi:hypothetical protein
MTLPLTATAQIDSMPTRNPLTNPFTMSASEVIR